MTISNSCAILESIGVVTVLNCYIRTMTDFTKCALISCSRSINHYTECFVEIKSYIDNDTTPNPKFRIRWGPDYEASLHKSCWEEILTARLSRKERTLIRRAEKTVEIHESLERVKVKAEKVVQLLKSAKYAVAFTGAGISTSAGIGDFRGKNGKWTMENQQPTVDSSTLAEEDVNYEQLRPTLCHELIVKLNQMGVIKHIISQNGDGLHELSGLQPGINLSELHGNVFTEKCTQCGQRFRRKFYVVDDEASEYFEALEDGIEPSPKKPRLPWLRQCSTCGLNHRTCRKCPVCSEYLQDTIINFGDDLEEDIFSKAHEEAARSDVMLCLGSTITVTPASDLTKLPSKLIVCNRQKVDLDHSNQPNRYLFIYSDCDVLMEEIGKALLGQDFDAWRLSLSKKSKDYNSQRVS